MTIAVHLSDTHAHFPPLPKDAELVLHTGDFCPNFLRNGRVENEREDQEAWLRRKQFTITKWLGGRRMLVIQGNHDWATIVGPNVQDITNTVLTEYDVTFAGFPYVPSFGPWAHGLPPEQLEVAARHIPACDVLLAHCPPYGVLDMCPSGHIGNQGLTERLRDPNPPMLVLCGHVHESGGGAIEFHNSWVMNNATTMRVFPLQETLRDISGQE
jgi:Icc-related predicted phosphoesterase